MLGTFVGQANETKPVEHHPLGDLLIRWSAVRPAAFQSSAFVEWKEMTSGTKSITFFFNHADKPAHVSYAATHESTGMAHGESLSIRNGKVEFELPAQSVRAIVSESR